MQVQDIVMAAMLAAEPELHSAARMHVPHRTNCFEVSYMPSAYCQELILDCKSCITLIGIDQRTVRNHVLSCASVISFLSLFSRT